MTFFTRISYFFESLDPRNFVADEDVGQKHEKEKDDEAEDESGETSIIVCPHCNRKLSGKKATENIFDEKYYEMLFLDENGYSTVCGECQSHEIVRSTQTQNFNLPIICPCKKATCYAFLESNEFFAVFCKNCCRVSKIKLASSGNRWEAWSDDGCCPACASAPVRISVVDEDLYKCDQCGIDFRVNDECKKLLKNCFGDITFANVISSVKSLRPGDHLSCGGLQRGKCAVLLELRRNDLLLLNDERQEQLVKHQDLSTPVYRLEYLPHDRLASHQTLSAAAENLSKSLSSESLNFSVFLKTGLDAPTQDLSHVSVKEDIIIRQCLECGESLCRSSIHDLTDLNIILSCSACDKLFQVLNTPCQHVHLTHRYGKSCSTEKIERMHQLGVGDVVFYEDEDDDLSVYYIIIGINREREEIDCVEFCSPKDHDLPKIEEMGFSFRDFTNSRSLKLHRFLPLDCLPVDRVIERAMRLAMKNYKTKFYFFSDSHDIVKWCKTDEIDNKRCHLFRKIYGYIPIGISTLIKFTKSGSNDKQRVLSVEWSNRKRFYKHACSSSMEEEQSLLDVGGSIESETDARSIILFL